ncbi:hypothetical protein BDA99DRAFT_573873 [Phascolomyces articulosus]|uniref:Uncharacterized protein n=1 Tax=Phascolomyces articulosus TaxID=60185 RepID=A0AAD5K4G1_9FUNG|nr:hypothetical protein BDA99DRAFT_573873 [Phascolomyces articulosus]
MNTTNFLDFLDRLPFLWEFFPYGGGPHIGETMTIENCLYYLSLLESFTNWNNRWIQRCSKYLYYIRAACNIEVQLKFINSFTLKAMLDSQSLIHHIHNFTSNYFFYAIEYRASIKQLYYIYMYHLCAARVQEQDVANHFIQCTVEKGILKYAHKNTNLGKLPAKIQLKFRTNFSRLHMKITRIRVFRLGV